MAHYSIYIPAALGATNEHLRGRGLADLCRDGDRGPEWGHVLDRGPDGGRGMLAQWRTGDPRTDPLWGVQLDRQTWRAAPASADGSRPAGAWWLGWEPGRPPSPPDLLRRQIYTGREVILADGRAWLIPEAWKLPRRVGLEPESGQARLEVAPAFRAFCDAAEQFAVTICHQIGALEQLRAARPAATPEQLAVEFTLVESWEFAVQALALNYRLTRELVAALELLEERHVVAVLSAVIGLADILEVTAKKKEATIAIPVTSSI